MNPIKRTWMKVRGTLFPSEDYFIKNADAPSRLLEGALETTKAAARNSYSVCKKAEVPAAVDVRVHAANNQIDATARLAYDPDQPNLRNRLEDDEKAIVDQALHQATRNRTVIDSETQSISFEAHTQTQYHGHPYAHSDTEITIPHGKIVGNQPTLDVFHADPLYDGATGSPISTTTQTPSSYS